MGNATTRLHVENTTPWEATLNITVNEPRHKAGSRTVSYNNSIPSGAMTIIEITRSSVGHVQALAVLSYTNGTVVRFSFGVVDHDCDDTVLLQPERVVYNNVPRGSTQTPRSSTAAVKPRGGAAACLPGPQHSAPVRSIPCTSAAPAPTRSACRFSFACPSLSSSTSTSSVPPRAPATGTPSPPTAPAATPGALFPFPVGAKICLTSLTSARNVRIREDGIIDASGGNGPYSTFIVSPNNGYLRLQSFKYPEKFIAIRDGYLTFGPGTYESELFAKQVGPELFVFRAVHSPAGLGFLLDGQPTLPRETYDGPYAQFLVGFVQ
jgi:hypothetical protein